MATVIKRVHKEVTLELKYKALVELDKGKTNKEVALLFGIPPNTLSKAGSVSNKRVKADTYEQVNKAVLQWFKEMRAENIPVNGSLIKE